MAIDKHPLLFLKHSWNNKFNPSGEINSLGTDKSILRVYELISTSLVPRPPPRFYLAAAEKNRLEIKSGRRPGNEAGYLPHEELLSVPHSQSPMPPGLPGHD